MEINVYYKNVYGTDVCYPACDDAKIFVSIVGSERKTLSTHMLDLIKSLGYKINVVDPRTGKNYGWIWNKTLRSYASNAV